MAEAKSNKQDEIYHERQRLQMCAIHAINNLFQGSEVLQRKEMNEICNNLSPNSMMNPHKSVLGVGNYDINAIMAVMSLRGYEVVWFDKRRSPEEINIDKLYGILINTVGKWTAFGYQFSLKLFRHWFSIKKINDHYYNLDSQLKKPEVIGNEADVCCYLKSKLAENNTELLLVVDKQVAEDRSWENRMLENEK